MAESASTLNNEDNEIPRGVSIESASYMENNSDIKINHLPEEGENISQETLVEEYTPRLFSEEQTQAEHETKDPQTNEISEQLFDQDNNEDEDFEIPAFLRRQKF